MKREANIEFLTSCPIALNLLNEFFVNAPHSSALIPGVPELWCPEPSGLSVYHCEGNPENNDLYEDLKYC